VPACASAGPAEDHLASLGGGEDQLRPLLAAAVGDQVDRRTPPTARAEVDLLDELWLVRPRAAGHGVAVERRGARPRPLGLEDEALAERHEHEVRQRAVRLRVACDEEPHPPSLAAADVPGEHEEKNLNRC
jgi:hypothetical protein